MNLSLVFCWYQLVYDIFETSYLRVILQVRGRDGMSTPQNSAAAYSQSHVSHICQSGFPLPFLDEGVMGLWEIHLIWGDK